MSHGTVPLLLGPLADCCSPLGLVLNLAEIEKKEKSIQCMSENDQFQIVMISIHMSQYGRGLLIKLILLSMGASHGERAFLRASEHVLFDPRLKAIKTAS